MHTNKGRTALRVITGVPMITGKATLEIRGRAFAERLHRPPAGILHPGLRDRAVGIIKLTPKTGVRVVENLTFEPVTKETEEEIDSVDIIIQEMAKGGLYKIWAQDPLPPGEYAVVQYTLGKMNMQIWDFPIKAK